MRTLIALCGLLSLVACNNPNAPSNMRPKGYLDWNTTAPACASVMVTPIPIVIGNALTTPVKVSPTLVYVAQWNTINYGIVESLWQLLPDETYGICYWQKVK